MKALAGGVCAVTLVLLIANRLGGAVPSAPGTATVQVRPGPTPTASAKPTPTAAPDFPSPATPSSRSLPAFVTAVIPLHQSVLVTPEREAGKPRTPGTAPTTVVPEVAARSTPLASPHPLTPALVNAQPLPGDGPVAMNATGLGVIALLALAGTAGWARRTTFAHHPSAAKPRYEGRHARPRAARKGQ